MTTSQDTCWTLNVGHGGMLGVNLKFPNLIGKARVIIHASCDYRVFLYHFVIACPYRN
jgi:hypothetical protein